MPWNDPNALLGIGGIVVGLVGIIISVFLYFRSKNKKVLEYHTNSFQLISKKINNISDISIKIDNQSVDDLVLTTIKFINAGNQVIASSDFAVLEPLGIIFKNNFFGSQQRFQCSADNPNSLPSIKIIDDKTLYIEFDFLNPKQSFSVTILHKGSFEIIGDLKGGKKLEYHDYLEFKFRRYIHRAFFFAIYAAIAPIQALVYIIYNIEDYTMLDTVFQPYIVPIELSVISLVSLVVLCYSFIKSLSYLSRIK